MTHFEYVMLMFHWFGVEIADHPGLQDPEYKAIIQALLALAND